VGLWTYNILFSREKAEFSEHSSIAFPIFFAKSGSQCMT
jgi:hypothetical protein